MKAKVLVLVLACLLVVGFAFASPGNEPTPAATGGGEVQLGGWLTMMHSGGTQNSDPVSPDRMASATSNHHFWRMGFEEPPLVGDFMKYGPRGTDQFAFQVRGYIPMTYMKGQLLESWDINSDRIIWHVRKGIYWQGNKPQVMKSRELVASDLVWWINYRRQAPAGSYIKQAINDSKEIDKYTLELPFAKGYDFMVMYLLGYEDRCNVEPPESVKAGAADWNNYVGTGPFLNTEYVVGSYFKYARNPDYYEKTTLNGKEYQLPLVDGFIFPIIPDEASRIASLRTGKLDWHAVVEPPQWSILDKVKGIVSSKVVGAVGQVLAMRVDQKPFDDINVRHALMIGTDMHAFNDILGVTGIDMPIDWHPAYPGDPSVYTPIDKLPAKSAELYKYDPVKAKKMLADAGYPNGFKMEVVTDQPVMAQERGSLLASQYAKIGVTVDVKVCDTTTYVGYRYDKNFKDGLITVVETPGAVFLLQRTAYTGATLNPAHYSSPQMDAAIDKIVGTIDQNEMNKLTKAACLQLLWDCPYVPLQVGLDGYYWWPWIQNYYGEFNVGDANQPVPLFARMWIDQKMKKDMGF